MTHQVLYPTISKQMPYSPKGVVDMALFHLDDDDKLRDLLPPPLNSVSVCSSASATAEDDSSTSVSSLEVDDEEDCWGQESQDQGQTTRRCIFGSYWKVKGGRPKEPLRGSCSKVTQASPFKTTEDDLPPASLTGDCSEDNSSVSSLSPLSPQEDHSDSYEDILEQSATSISRRPAAAPLGDDSGASLGSSRRRLFGDNHYSKSAPSLPQCVALPSDCIRKTQSSRGLEERRPSCLKECRRYSGTIPAARRPSKATVVSFSDDVEVKYVQKPNVVFAEKGWSKYFM
jgi:hypothetical protein